MYLSCSYLTDTVTAIAADTAVDSIGCARCSSLHARLSVSIVVGATTVATITTAAAVVQNFY
jgi:hypothetical protein